MKILVDVRLLSKGGAAGIEEYTKNLLRAVFEIDGKNEYLLFYNGFSKKSLPREITDFPNVKVIDWKIPNKIFDFINRFGYPEIDRFFGAEAVFSPHFNIINVSGKAKRIITIHDLSFVRYPEFFSRRKKFWHWLQNFRKQIGAADRIIAVSRFTKDDLAEIVGVPEKKITVIHSGVGSQFRRLSAKNEKWEKFKPFLLYLGTIEPRKNIISVAKAFEVIKKNGFNNLNLILAGARGWLFKDIIRAVEASPFSKDIVFAGRVGEEERLALYNSAELLLYPSFFEGFGFQPLEAQACGLPVIVSNRSSFPEIVGETALMVDPSNVDELARAAMEVLSDENLRSLLIERGFQNVKRFSWRKTAEETLKVLTK